MIISLDSIFTFRKESRLMRSPSSLCLSSHQLLKAWNDFNETCYTCTAVTVYPSASLTVTNTLIVCQPTEVWGRRGTKRPQKSCSSLAPSIFPSTLLWCRPSSQLFCVHCRILHGYFNGADGVPQFENCIGNKFIKSHFKAISLA